MKPIITAILFSFFFSISTAQNREKDSIIRQLEIIKDDTTRVNLLNHLGNIYRNSKIDTSLLLSSQALQISRDAGFLRGEAESLNGIGNIFSINGNYPKALELYLQMLKIYERLNNPRGMGVGMTNIANIYVEQGDYRQALSYYYKSKEIFDPKPTRALLSNLLNIGDTYEKLDVLDSALQFTQEGYELALRLVEVDYIGVALNNLGNIHAKMGHSNLALEYYRLSLPYSLKIDDYYVLGETYLGIAKVFEETGQRDSAYHYARLSLAMGKAISGQKFIKNAAELLEKNYSEQNQTDSAYYYSKIAAASRDSLFSEEKVKALQALKFNEQLRQQEIAQEKEMAQKDRKNKLQLLMIAIFIVGFFLFIILLIRKKTKPRFVEFMALLGLLLLFEFISLFIHPYVGQLTHHSPVYMLMILVCIAAVLVPSHHYLVKLVKQRLANKIITAPSEPVDDPGVINLENT